MCARGPAGIRLDGWRSFLRAECRPHDQRGTEIEVAHHPVQRIVEPVIGRLGEQAAGRHRPMFRRRNSEIFLASEVVEERALGDAGRRAELIYRSRVISLLQNNPQSRAQQTVSRRLGLTDRLFRRPHALIIPTSRYRPQPDLNQRWRDPVDLQAVPPHVAKTPGLVSRALWPGFCLASCVGDRRTMSQAAADPRLVAPRAAPRRRMRLSWSDPVFRAVVWQIVIVGIVAAIAWYLIRNTSANLAARHIATGFGFLSRVAGIPIGELDAPLQSGDRYVRHRSADRDPEHTESRHHRRRPGHHPRHADRHRPPVEELAAVEAHRLLRRNPARHPVTAPTAVLVRRPPGPARRRNKPGSSAASPSSPTEA